MSARRQPNGGKPQRPRSVHQQQERPGEKLRRPEFDHEYEGRTVRVILHNGATIIGKAETSKYWLKIQTAGSKHIYVNKAFIVMIEPAE